MMFDVKLSQILAEIESGETRFICNAIVAMYRDTVTLTKGKNTTVKPLDTYRQFADLYPEIFNHFPGEHDTLNDWLIYNKLPNNLRSLKLREYAGEFRIEFLTWFISKVGDQTITVEIKKA